MVNVDADAARLIGREAELALLRSFLDDAAADGAPRLLTGEPGVGKTALLAAAASVATARGFRVIWGSGVEYESDVSFAGLHQLVDPLTDELRQLPEPNQVAIDVAIGTGSGPPPERLAVLAASLALFRHAASAAPLLIVVDDLQWLDRASGAVIGFVGRRLRGSAIGLLGATRPGSSGFFERAGMPELAVSPLEQSAAIDLLTRNFVHLPSRVLERVAREAQGNPLALLEFAASAEGAGGDHVEGATAHRSASREVHALYQARIERLPEQARRMLLLAALDGTGSLGTLALASETHDVRDIAPAERDHLVIVDDQSGKLRFRHPMIRSAIVERSTHEERSDAHRRLAAALGDQPELRGHHLAQATQSPSAEAAKAIEESAHATLRRGDVAGAVSKLLRAAELSPDRESRSRRIADAAFLGAHSAGRLDSSSKLLREARRRDPTFDATLHAAVATAYLLLNSDGDAGSAYALLMQAIEAALADGERDGEGLSEGLYTLVLVCHYASRADYWPAFHRAMDRLGAWAPTEVRLLADTFANPLGASDSGLRTLDEQIRRLDEVEDDGIIVRTAIAAFYVDRLTECRGALLRVIEDGRGGGAVGSAMMAMSIVAHEALAAGHWDEARDLAVEATALWDDRGYRLYGFTGHYATALIAANRGDTDLCRRECELMVEWAEPRRLGIVINWANHARARAALGDGDFEEAFASAAAISPPGTIASHTPQALTTALDLIEAAVRTGRTEAAQAHADAVHRSRLARLSSRDALMADAAAALVAPDEEAPALFGTALSHSDLERWPLELSRVELLCGERLRRMRRPREARQHLVRALDGFERLGAVAFARRAEIELRATAGSRLGASDGAEAPLTPHEREVAMLAATGLTNRQIASQLFMAPRTVSAHLYRIFPKLGISSRAGLRDALNARDAGSAPTVR